MSANLPPSFKPIAHYIKIANENASRDPVIYYWWLCTALFAPAVTTKFDETTWRRLRDRIRGEDRRRAAEQRDELLAAMDDPEGIVRRHVSAERLAVEIQEKRIRCEELRKRCEKVNLRILMGRRKIGELDEQIREKAEEESKLETSVQLFGEQIEENRAKIDKMRKSIWVLTRLLTYRKLAMIQEVFSLFKVDIDGGPAAWKDGGVRQKQCQCELVDRIRGLHLPQASAFFTQHAEMGTSVALEHLVHLLSALCSILSYPVRYPTEGVPTTRILNPLEARTNVMSGWRRKSDREKVVEALGWLGKNVAQLRADSGIPTLATERTLGSLEEWFRLVESKQQAVFERPTEDPFSPASLLV